jgi:hypothetical protein
MESALYLKKPLEQPGVGRGFGFQLQFGAPGDHDDLQCQGSGVGELIDLLAAKWPSLTRQCSCRHSP